jgi:hypothetical protein
MASSSSVELSELQLKSTSELCEFLRTLSIPEDVVDKFESKYNSMAGVVNYCSQVINKLSCTVTNVDSTEMSLS